MPLADGTITLGDVLSDQYADQQWTIDVTGDDVADYASVVWYAGNAKALPTLAALQAGKPTAQANIAAAAKAARVATALQQQQDQTAKALGILADGIDQLNKALKATSFTAGATPTIASLAALRTKIAAVLATG